MWLQFLVKTMDSLNESHLSLLLKYLGVNHKNLGKSWGQSELRRDTKLGQANSREVTGKSRGE